MKLLRVKILGQNFRSLPANVDYVFNDTLTEDKLSTKVFAGLNGSGKSNFLELIAEIFYSLERYILNESANKKLDVQRSELLKDLAKYTSERHPKKYQNISKKIDELNKKIFFDRDFNFEIEYLIPNKSIHTNVGNSEILEEKFDNFIHVKIIKQQDKLPEYNYKDYSIKSFVRLDNKVNQLLPEYVMAYTSGQNELLSNPFIRLRYHYLNEIQNSPNSLYNRRMYFIDEESNYSIFVANMLLGQEQPLSYLKNIFGIEDLYSFRITVNYKHNTKEADRIFKIKLTLLEPLKACASTWKDDTEKKVLVLDFIINNATHQAFKYFYKSAFNLFKVLYELQSLNLLIDKQELRKFVVNDSKVLNVTDELSKPDPSDLVFRIEKIRIKKTTKETEETRLIFYKALSDGEHQLNEVIGSVMMMENEGSLFLMDEPDTHFNPKWRAKMVTMLNQVSGNEYDKDGNPERIRQHEVIMTTHSPFIISDNQKEAVYKFERTYSPILNEKKEIVDYVPLLNLKNPKHETYGASITFLMKQIFERDITISDYANQELISLKDELKNIQDKSKKAIKIDEIEERLLDFGESIEKFDLYNYLSQIKKD